MKVSQLFTKTQKTYPKDEVSISSQLLIRGGFIDKVSAGIYTLLPLGLKVADNLIKIIREEMEAIGGQEILMPGLVPKANWVQTGRWENFDALFKLKGADEKEYALGATHEEIISPLAKKFVLSYKDLPLYLFQIQNKFRNELRAKSGVLRTREFLMKDLYSFHVDEEDLDRYYEKVKAAYWKILARAGIKDKTYFTFASGGDFTKYSHEFQTEAEGGEDEIYVCRKCRTGLNREIVQGEYKCPQCGEKEYDLKKCIEVGNIFKLKTKFSQPFGLSYKDKNDREKPVEMGCYGLGVQRLMGTIIEVSHDEKGMIWPSEAAPYQVYFISLIEDRKKAEEIYQTISAKASVLFDDREVSAGEKFAEADLIGLPYRIVLSEKTKEKIELKKRGSGETELLTPEAVLGRIRQ